MRDTRNPQSIQRRFDFDSTMIPKLRQGAKNGESEREVRTSRFMLITLEADNLTCRYSMGFGKDEIKDVIVNGVADDYFNYYIHEIGNYMFLANVMSLSILTEVGEEHFESLVKLVRREKINDPFLNFLIAFSKPDWVQVGGQFTQKKPFERLKGVIDATDEAKGIRELLDYLKKWYGTYRGDYWHDLHTRENGRAYTGYWCWEAAAIVKIKGWDDTKLKDNEYYPYDAVHW